MVEEKFSGSFDLRSCDFVRSRAALRMTSRKHFLQLRHYSGHLLYTKSVILSAEHSALLRNLVQFAGGNYQAVLIVVNDHRAHLGA